MSTIVNFINSIKIDKTSFEDNNKYKKFFFKSITHLIVSLEIASSSTLGGKISYDKLKSSILSSLGNENKVREAVNEGIENKFFIEKKSKKNSKQSYYKISKNYSLMITDWFSQNKSKFN